jgi:hypothetical protein
MSTSITLLPSQNNILTGSATALVASSNLVRNFDPSTDYVELHVLNPIGGILYSNSNFKNYTIPGLGPQTSGSISVQELKFNPENDLKNLGITSGEYNLQYNILRPQIVPSNNQSFFIKEISANRTEIRLSTSRVYR